MSYLNDKYSRTLAGLVGRIYSAQKFSSKKRGFVEPGYTKRELYSWATHQPEFRPLYKQWKMFRFSKMLRPSFDRKDDYLPYTLDNLQVMTWKQNRDKYYLDRVTGINTKTRKKVIQFDLNSVFVKVHESVKDAALFVGLKKSSNISSVCKGDRATAGGFKWEYA